MRLPDGSILMHDATRAYDPQKAHEYYLRTRKLKGRKTKLAGGITRESKPTGGITREPIRKVTKKKSRSPNQQINDIKKKFDRLMQQRSSGDVQKRLAVQESSAAKVSAAKQKADRKASADEIFGIRKELAGLSASLKDKTKSETEKKTIEQKISDAKERLAAATEKARSLSG